MAGFVNGEIVEVNEEKIGCAERGVEEEESVEDEPGDAGGFGDRFPFAEVVRGNIRRAWARRKRSNGGLRGKGRKEESFQRKGCPGREAGRIATESQRTQRTQREEGRKKERKRGRKKREPLFAAEEAAGGLFDQAIGENRSGDGGEERKCDAGGPWEAEKRIEHTRDDERMKQVEAVAGVAQ